MLPKMNSPPPVFNFSMVQEFFANVPFKLLESGGQVFVRKVCVLFDSLVICEVLGLEPSFFADMYYFDLITCHYDMKIYHREVYLDTYIHLSKGQVSKSHLKSFYSN